MCRRVTGIACASPAIRWSKMCRGSKIYVTIRRGWVLTSEDSCASDAYLAAKALWEGVTVQSRRRRRSSGEPGGLPFSKGRDPKPLAEIFAATAQDLGWTSEIEQAQLIADWPILIGESTAAHTRVVELR